MYELNPALIWWRLAKRWLGHVDPSKQSPSQHTSLWRTLRFPQRSLDGSLSVRLTCACSSEEGTGYVVRSANQTDLDRKLSELMHDARHDLKAECQTIISNAIQHNALNGSRVWVTQFGAAERLHKNAIERARSYLLDFEGRTALPAAEITRWARPHLENLSKQSTHRLPFGLSNPMALIARFLRNESTVCFATSKPAFQTSRAHVIL
jgi:hypothetical protein